MSKLAFFALLPFSMAWKGYALSVLWDWFVVAALNAPALSVPAAIGVAVIVNFTTNNKAEITKTEYEFVASQAMRPAIALLLGWVVKFWM